MLKYVDAQVVFAEVPDEITLAISISGCPCHCKGCHSSYLAEDIGEELTPEVIDRLIHNNNGITCVALMGGDAEPIVVSFLAGCIKEEHPEIRVAWYSGRQELSKDIELRNFDYIKLGPYIEELGPLSSRTTNQRLYRVEKEVLIDITNKFWK